MLVQSLQPGRYQWPQPWDVLLQSDPSLDQHYAPPPLQWVWPPRYNVEHVYCCRLCDCTAYALVPSDLNDEYSGSTGFVVPIRFDYLHLCLVLIFTTERTWVGLSFSSTPVLQSLLFKLIWLGQPLWLPNQISLQNNGPTPICCHHTTPLWSRNWYQKKIVGKIEFLNNRVNYSIWFWYFFFNSFMLLVVAIWIDKSKHAKLNQLWPPNKKVQKVYFSAPWIFWNIIFPIAFVEYWIIWIPRNLVNGLHNAKNSKSCHFSKRSFQRIFSNFKEQLEEYVHFCKFCQI